jgi:hypothetical protein
MNRFLLDAGGAGLILLIPIAFIFLLFVWGLVEGFIINLFRINRFWKSVWHAIIVNIVSLIIGFVMIGVANKMGLQDYTELEATMKLLPTWIVFLLVSILVEGLVLKALNRSKSWSTIFSASLVMNLLTYIILFAYTYYYI